MGKSSGTPPQPDYVGAAKEQGQQNIQAAQVGAALNRVNTNTPYGSLTYSQPDPKDPNRWQADVTLSPDQQKLLNYTTSGQLERANAGSQLLSGAEASLGRPIDTSSLPGFTGNVSPGTMSAYSGNPNTAQTSLDTSGVPQLNTDWGTQTQQAQEAAYNREKAMLDPQYQQQEEALRARLAASGATEGSDAYSNAYKDFNNQKANDYAAARNDAIGIGNNEQATLANESLAGNNQLFSQALSKGNFNNQGAAQNFAQGLEANRNNNNVVSGNLQNAIAAGSFGNAARGQAISENAYLRELPLNEYNALTSGTQVTQPNFNVGTAQVGSPAPAPTFQGAQLAGQNAINAYNQGIATNNANTAAAGSALSALLAAFLV